jgi:fumarate reductase flavoprotein subunit
MIKKYTGYEWGKDLHSFRIPGNVGDGMRMAWEVGAQSTPIRIELIYNVADVTIGGAVDWLTLMRQPHLMLNLLGERFINEAEGNTAFKGNAISLQKERQCFFVFDENTKDEMKTYLDFLNMITGTPNFANIDEMIKTVVESQYPHFFVCDSAEDMAAKTGMDLGGLKATLEQYNNSCDHGYDELFVKPHRFLRPVRKAPFYALRLFPSGYGSLGGIKINHKTEVLDKDWHSIPGLYAAGMDACDIYGDTYVFLLPGNTMGFALNSGRIAGEQASAYVKSLG